MPACLPAKTRLIKNLIPIYRTKAPCPKKYMSYEIIREVIKAQLNPITKVDGPPVHDQDFPVSSINAPHIIYMQVIERRRE